MKGKELKKLKLVYVSSEKIKCVHKKGVLPIPYLQPSLSSCNSSLSGLQHIIIEIFSYFSRMGYIIQSSRYSSPTILYNVKQDVTELIDSDFFL